MPLRPTSEHAAVRDYYVDAVTGMAVAAFFAANASMICDHPLKISSIAMN
jgi:hypothetical protein